MNFTREPIVQTVITPRESCRLVIRSSRGVSGEEFLVDAVEIVSFGPALFFRSLERPKSFLLPVSDYEVVEVRESRMVLKNVGLMERGRNGAREAESGGGKGSKAKQPAAAEAVAKAEEKGERKRRRTRRRRGREGTEAKPEEQEEPQPAEAAEISENPTEEGAPSSEAAPPVPRVILPPPPALIRDKLEWNRPKSPSPEEVLSEEEPSLQEEEEIEEKEEEEESAFSAAGFLRRLAGRQSSPEQAEGATEKDEES